MSLSKIYKKNQGIQETAIRPVDLHRIANLKSESLTAGQENEQSAGLNPGNGPKQNNSGPTGAQATDPFVQQKIINLEKAEARFNETAQALAGSLEEISRIRKTIYLNSTQDMLRLVLAISRQVIQNEISINKDIILNVVTQALHAALKSSEFHVKVHPDDFDLVNEKKPLFLASISGLENITFEADPNVTRGGCIVESDIGQVDATIETKLDEIYQQLLTSVTDNNGTPG